MKFGFYENNNAVYSVLSGYTVEGTVCQVEVLG